MKPSDTRLIIVGCLMLLAVGCQDSTKVTILHIETDKDGKTITLVESTEGRRARWNGYWGKTGDVVNAFIGLGDIYP